MNAPGVSEMLVAGIASYIFLVLTLGAMTTSTDRFVYRLTSLRSNLGRKIAMIGALVALSYSVTIGMYVTGAIFYDVTEWFIFGYLKDTFPKINSGHLYRIIDDSVWWFVYCSFVVRNIPSLPVCFENLRNANFQDTDDTAENLELALRVLQLILGAIAMINIFRNLSE